MAQVKVDSSVLRDKANTLNTAADKIENLYTEMLQEVKTMANKMQGTAIETAESQFAGMQSTFETFAKNIKDYGNFLTQAAESYEKLENEATQKAQEQGKIFG